MASIEEALLASPEVLLYRAELLRLRGEIRLRSSSGSEANRDIAEQDFRAAIGVARAMGAKSDELRATTSLASFCLRPIATMKRAPCSTAIYGWFTEGFDTADLRKAKLLLDDLE
jgi:hypothetical protein